MKNEVITEINTNEPVGVRRFQIIDDDFVKDFDKNGNIVDKHCYTLSTSKNDGTWTAIGDLTRDEIITLGIVIQRFINQTK